VSSLRGDRPFVVYLVPPECALVIWLAILALLTTGRGLYKDSALLSLTNNRGGHGSHWFARRSIGADCVRCNAWLTAAIGVYTRRVLSSLVDSQSADRMLILWYPRTQHLSR